MRKYLLLILACLAGPIASASGTEAEVLNIAAVPIGDCMPTWPQESVLSMEEGLVWMQVQVGTNGAASDLRLVKSSGFERLDQASMKTAAGCKFAPASSDGKLAPAWFQLAFRWKPAEPCAGKKTGCISCPRLAYPEEDLRSENQGSVSLAYLVDAAGNVRDSRLIKSSGYHALDRAARAGFAKCRFKPATENGKPIEAWLPLTAHWIIEN